MNVEHIMTKDPVACDATDTLQDAARHMRDKNVGAVVVLREGRLGGIVTDRQIALALADDDEAASTKVEEIMEDDPGRVTLEANLFEVLDTMRSAGVVRRVPVVNEDEQLVGLVSISDVAVLGERIMEALLLEETHHSQDEPKIQTGGKRLGQRLRKPSTTEHLEPQQETRVVATATPDGRPDESGRASRSGDGSDGQ